ncbi:MAG: hypothetical protein AB2687_00515 [Candidatus Thiodiazotropha taylori]
MSEEQKTPPGGDLGIDGAQRESEFDRLAAEAGADQTATPGQQVQQQEPETAEILQPIFEMGFGILAPGWGVTPGECKQLSEAYGQLFDKYFPEGMGDYGAEVSAVMLTAAVVLPRMKLPRKVETPPDAKSVEGSDNGQ